MDVPEVAAVLLMLELEKLKRREWTSLPWVRPKGDGAYLYCIRNAHNLIQDNDYICIDYFERELIKFIERRY